MYKHLFFDLDNTLTRSRSLIVPEMRAELLRLISGGKDIIVVSGATEAQIIKQMGEEFRDKIYILAQNGNKATLCGNRVGWADNLNVEQK